MNDVSHIATSEQIDPASRENKRSPVLADILVRIEPTLTSAVGPTSSLVTRFRTLRNRLEHERFQLAVLGQFKRGKSTFINALLGGAVLPTGVVPLTAVATFIAWGPAPRVVVSFKGASRREEFRPQTTEEIRNALFRFVAEEGNPENRLGVERVDLFYPADILVDGTVIIDTPGVGSTLQHNTETALQVLPECDAVFFVISADPPITEVELEYLRRLKSKTPRIFFVLNKTDYLVQDEKRTVVGFLQKVLIEKSLVDGEPRVFCISAREGLAAKQNGNKQALQMSGVATLEEYLLRVLASEKNRWLEEAVQSKTTDILVQASTELDLRMRAMNMPIEQLTEKSEAFKDALRSIENERRVTRDLVVGEHRRLREALDSRIGNLRKATAAKLTAVIDASLSDTVPTAWEEAARRSISAAMQTEFDTVCEPFVNTFATDACAALHGCQDRVNALVDRVRQTAAQIFDVSLCPNAEHEVFELGEDPYWLTESNRMTLIPDPSRLIDRLLPASLRRPRLRARMIRQAEELIVRNAENLRWAILRGLDETFRKATAQFEERLDEAIGVTRNVIADALARRRDRSFEVQPELLSLSSANASLASLREELQGERLWPNTSVVAEIAEPDA